MQIQTTQQMYTDDKKFRIAGDSVNLAEQFIDVTPEKIAGSYDYLPVDGTLPIDRFAMVSMWGNLFSQLRNFPEIAQQYNMAEVFAWVAQLAGLKNIKQFKINVLPPGAGAEGAGLQAGGQSGGAGRTQSGGGTRGGGTQGPSIPLPRQVPGVGPSG
jgi:hypothetical protein